MEKFEIEKGYAVFLRENFKGPNILFEIERYSRQREVETERVHCFYNQFFTGRHNITQNVNSNEAHGHDNIRICMLKRCVSTIYKPLELNFKEAVSTGLFPSKQKKGNIAPIHEKGDNKQILKIYRPVSIIVIYGKIAKIIFERLIFNELFNYLLENNLISQN